MKLTEKKMKLLGKEVSVFLVVTLAVMGLGAAMLVPYLSNMITGNVTVESPLKFSDVSGEGITCSVLENGDIDCGSIGIHGGESFSVTQTISNEANIPSPAFYSVIKVSNLADPEGLTVTYSTGSLVDQEPVGIYTDELTEITYYYFGYPEGNVYPVDYTETGTLKVTTAPNFAPGTYGVTAGTVLADQVPEEAFE